MTAKPKTQVQKFREAARELETDDSEKRFNERLGKIARAAKPERSDAKRPKPSKKT
jgi:hypothetical protein